MESQLIEAQSLAIIDQEIGEYSARPAEYEIIRRVIYQTADYEYQFLIRFFDQSLKHGAAALASRTTIIVDVPMVKAGIHQQIQQTFFNPVYCAADITGFPPKHLSPTAWGLQTLAKRYPEAIFIIGHDQTALNMLLELIKAKMIKPALVIATPCGFVNIEQAKQKLIQYHQPHITIEERKGGATVAVAIANGLMDLAWQVYGKSQDL